MDVPRVPIIFQDLMLRLVAMPAFGFILAPCDAVEEHVGLKGILLRTVFLAVAEDGLAENLGHGDDDSNDDR